MKIRLIGHSGEAVFPFGTAGPWKEFEATLLSHGHTICAQGMNEGADAIIAHFYGKEVGAYMARWQIPREKRILVLWEPYVVETTRYRKSVLSKFGTTFAASVEWAKVIKAHPFNWPQGEILDEDVFTGWNLRQHRAVMVQGNKFSARKGELYSLRRKVIIMLGQNKLDLYGTNWNKGFCFDIVKWIISAKRSRINQISFNSLYRLGNKYSNYCGNTNDKPITLSQYKIAIVIENSADFVSEKLFDAVRSGCVTVYVGPDLRTFKIPISSAIQVGVNPKLISKTVEILLGKSDEELEDIARSQRSTLQTVSQDWDNTRVLSKLAGDMMAILEG